MTKKHRNNQCKKACCQNRTECPSTEIEQIFSKKEKKPYKHKGIREFVFFCHLKNFAQLFCIPNLIFQHENIVNYSTYFIWQGFSMFRSNVTDIKWWRLLHRMTILKIHVLTSTWWESKRICVGIRYNQSRKQILWTSILAPLINEIRFVQLTVNMYCTWHIHDNVRETFITSFDADNAFTWT